MTKKCTHCKVEKLAKEFNKDSSRKDHIAAGCRSCVNQIGRSWYEKNKKQRISQTSAYAKKFRLENKEKVAKLEKLRYWRNRDKLLERKLKERYGITLLQKEALFTKQKGLCAICKQSDKLVVDHCHKTLKVRGLLCKNCNSGIGMLKDNANRMRAAIEYLKKHQP